MGKQNISRHGLAKAMWVVLILLFKIGCGTTITQGAVTHRTQPSERFEWTGLPYLKVVQDGRTTWASDLDVVALEREAFALYFPVRFYQENGDAHNRIETEFVLTTQASIFERCEPGIHAGDHANPFGNGRSMALPDTPFTYAFVADDRHHSMLYGLVREGEFWKRAESVRQLDSNHHEVIWNITTFKFPHPKRGDIPIENWTANSVYLVLWMDLDLNNRFDAGEVLRVELQFTQP